MALAQRITLTETQHRRQRQRRAELRLDEIVKVAGIADDYATVDARGDRKIEQQFAKLYALVNDPAEREAVAAAFAIWQKCEEDEEAALIGSVGGSVRLLKLNNPVWLDGAAVPADSDGAA